MKKKKRRLSTKNVRGGLFFIIEKSDKKDNNVNISMILCFLIIKTIIVYFKNSKRHPRLQ
jgi:hypothetical protein